MVLLMHGFVVEISYRTFDSVCGCGWGFCVEGLGSFCGVDFRSFSEARCVAIKSADPMKAAGISAGSFRSTKEKVAIQTVKAKANLTFSGKYFLICSGKTRFNRRTAT